MSEHSRALPDRPSLRFLKVEAKRRLAAGEFRTLHEAQLAIAREHGHSSWAALKAAIEPNSRAVPHVRWLVERFRDSDEPGWTGLDDAELREHVEERFLELVTAEALTRQLRSVAVKLRAELRVDATTTDTVRAEAAGLRIEASAGTRPPHRLSALRMYPVAKTMTDTRVAGPRTHAHSAPEQAVRLAERSTAELGLPGLIFAGDPEWTVARGWADLDRREQIRPDHRFPAYGVTKVVTAVAALRLVDGKALDLDARVNDAAHGVRLENDSVTIRDLLTHTAGVVGPAAQFAVERPESAYHGSIPRAGRHAGDGDYAVLGMIIADVTGMPYADAARNLVFEPLEMTGSDFPDRWPGNAVVTGYHLAGGGTFEEAERHVSTTAAAGGLWTTAPDLVRFGRTWTTLLSDDLAREAIRPQAGRLALGWLANSAKGVYGHSGAGPGVGVSLIIRLDTGRVTVAATNRQVPIEPVNARLARTIV